jgi:hypothetical protein
VITSWSPSRLTKYEACPSRAKYEIVDKLCPLCFQGRMEGKWQEEKCSTCGNGVPTPETWARGTAIHSMLEKIVNGGTANPTLQEWVVEYAKKLVPAKTEIDFVFQPGWVAVSQYTKGAWARFKLDVLKIHAPPKKKGLTQPPYGLVVDWKTGGIDKRTKMVRVDGKYDDQLEMYGVAVLSALSGIETAKIDLVFVDAAGRKDGVKDLGTVKRKDLAKLQKKWEKRVKPMLIDDVFSPRPSDYGCRYCPFEKAKGGPCPY